MVQVLSLVLTATCLLGSSSALPSPQKNSAPKVKTPLHECIVQCDRTGASCAGACIANFLAPLALPGCLISCGKDSKQCHDTVSSFAGLDYRAEKLTIVCLKCKATYPKPEGKFTSSSNGEASTVSAEAGGEESRDESRDESAEVPVPTDVATNEEAIAKYESAVNSNKMAKRGCKWWKYWIHGGGEPLQCD